MLFYAVYRIHPAIEDEIRFKKRTVDTLAAKGYVEELLQIRKNLEAQWQSVVVDQAKYYDKKYKPRQFAVSQKVWLSGKNIKSIWLSKKLDYKFYRLYKIINAIRK